MAYPIPSFEIFQKKNGMFLVWTLGGFCIDFKLCLLEFGLSLMVLHFFLAGSVVGTLIHLRLALSSLENLCKISNQILG